MIWYVMIPEEMVVTRQQCYQCQWWHKTSRTEWECHLKLRTPRLSLTWSWSQMTRPWSPGSGSTLRYWTPARRSTMASCVDWCWQEVSLGHKYCQFSSVILGTGAGKTTFCRQLQEEKSTSRKHSMLRSKMIASYIIPNRRLSPGTHIVQVNCW